MQYFVRQSVLATFWGALSVLVAAFCGDELLF
jgi:hypothetical protein